MADDGRTYVFRNCGNFASYGLVQSWLAAVKLDLINSYTLYGGFYDVALHDVALHEL